MAPLSPRFLALPAIALAVIVALSQAQSGASSHSTEIAAPTVHRAGTCAIPAQGFNAACAFADRGAGATAMR